ncbi:uncharacterized protein LOC119685791 [Teleopsis dalmanni]|uniref:uncharacterized protein LOC119685791 n=1 Tax=Teleopsis dalmanni TaxID=139649 RepID=UPI0018CD01E6|nr:uncharacterized protein LOC119685791 [Teleopsis dalmanni]
MESKKARYIWGETEEKLLLDVWEKKLPDLKKTYRNGNVLVEITRILASKGVFADSTEINNKIKNLTAKYRSEKKIMDLNGGAPSTFKHFNRVHSIIESQPCNNLTPNNESFNFQDSIPDEIPTPCISDSISDDMEAKKGRHLWTESDEDVLLDVWEFKLPELKKAKRNSRVYGDISKMLASKGVFADATEITTKIKNLTYRYRSEKKKLDYNSGAPSAFRHFYRIHNIIESFECNSHTSSNESFVFINQYQETQSQSPPLISELDISLPLKSSPATVSPPMSPPPLSPPPLSAPLMSPTDIALPVKLSPAISPPPLAPLTIWLPHASPTAILPTAIPQTDIIPTVVPPISLSPAIKSSPPPSPQAQTPPQLLSPAATSSPTQTSVAITADRRFKKKKKERDVLTLIHEELKEANRLARAELEMDKKFLDILQKMSNR